MLTLIYKPIADLTPAELHRLYEIAAPHYEDARPVFSRDVQHCTHVYLMQNEATIVAFFMVAWESISLEGRTVPSLFLGLTCADRQYRYSKVNAIFCQAVLDIYQWKQAYGEPLVMWCTTATPIVLKIVPKYWTLLAPGLNGRYDERYVSIADAIRQQYFSHGQPASHPFVLKGVATATRYSESERAYLTEVSGRLNVSTFEQLGINERNGDRLLMLMDVPEDEKLARHQAELSLLLPTTQTTP